MIEYQAKLSFHCSEHSVDPAADGRQDPENQHNLPNRELRNDTNEEERGLRLMETIKTIIYS